MVKGGKGGLWDTTSLGGNAWAIFYVQVDDVKAAIARAESLGVSITVPFVDNNAIEFAHLLDPQGNRFGVWRFLGECRLPADRCGYPLGLPFRPSCAGLPRCSRKTGVSCGADSEQCGSRDGHKRRTLSWPLLNRKAASDYEGPLD